MPAPRFEAGISISELARILGVERETVMKRLKHLGDGATLEQIIGALCDSGSIEETRKRKLKAEASVKELELRQKQGELIPRSDVLAGLVAYFRHFRNEIAVLLPRRVANRLIGKKTEAEIISELNREIDRIFDDVRNRTDIFASAQDGNSAAQSDGFGLGGTKPNPEPRQLRRARPLAK